MRRLVLMVWLTAVWVTLWESVTWANVLGGLVVASVVMSMIPPRHPDPGVGLRPVAAVKLLLYFLWELAEASAIVAWEVATPRIRINAAVVSVRLTSDVAGIITSVASMVSLTPGTVTLEVDEETSTLFIHVLHLRSLELTRESVRRLERLTLEAFPPRPTPGERLGSKEVSP